MITIKDILEISSIKELLKNSDTNVYLVGGFVRDMYLQKKSKDIDIVVSGLEIDNLIELLKPFGYIDIVGKSYGIIKHKPNDSDLELDIALPRKDQKIENTKNAYRNFKIIIDHNLPIYEELERRDCTFNSIAYDLRTNNVIDPFNGLIDLKNRLIKATSKTSFADDPLRILRAIRFASIFDFDIEDETYKLMIANIESLCNISFERVLIELDKIHQKGNIKKGFDLLRETGALKYIANVNPLDYNITSKITRGEFYFLLLQESEHPELIFKELKGDIDTINDIKALNVYRKIFNNKLSIADKKLLMIKLFNISKNITTFTIFNDLVKMIAYYNTNPYPVKITDLNISGEDLIAKGLKNKDIGIKLKFLFYEVIVGNRENTLEDLLKD